MTILVFDCVFKLSTFEIFPRFESYRDVVSAVSSVNQTENFHCFTVSFPYSSCGWAADATEIKKR